MDETEVTVLLFLGWLCAELPELRTVEVPRLLDCWDRFKESGMKPRPGVVG